MNPDGAAGPDGFGGIFFVHCWNIIKDDLTSAVQAFFNGSNLPKYLKLGQALLLSLFLKSTILQLLVT